MRAFRLIFTVYAIFSISSLLAHFSPQTFNRELIYQALRSDDLQKIENQIKVVEANIENTAIAFSGALLMKQAGLLKDPAQKLKVFKQGNRKLEQAISTHPANVEFKFLRLLIQENAPKFLNYNSNIEEDSKAVSEHFKDLPTIVQQQILSYSKNSKALTQNKLEQAHE